MSAVQTGDYRSGTDSQSVVVPPPIMQVAHWLNVIAIFFMGGGWNLYDHAPLFEVASINPGGCWEHGGYNWVSGN